MIKVATAFSGGLAAPEFALKYEGIPHQVVFACEWDKYARQQYLTFHGEPKTFYEDIQDLDATQYKDEIDLFIWGSPCTSLSVAGKREGLEGESRLFFEGLRVQNEMKPKIFIFENVKGLLSSNKGEDFKVVLESFKSQGYHIKYQVLNTKDYGIPQNRERVFIVGFLDESKCEAFQFEPKQMLNLRLKDVLDTEVDEKYYLNKPLKKSTFNQANSRLQEKDFCDTLLARDYKDPKLIKVGDLDIKGNESIKRVYSTEGISPTLTTMGGGNREPKILDYTSSYGEQEVREYDKYSPTLRAGRSGLAWCTDNRIRKLTPRECFKLQGVKGEDINIVVSNTQAYKIAGNAMSVNVLQSIFRSLSLN
jgi:DNA (cytosine-5)-methyltransferase 1